MTSMRHLKHLPEADWPPEDLRLFERAFEPGDVFDDRGAPGAHLSERSRRTIRFGWRRWLAFLAAHHPDDLLLKAVDRVTPDRVRAYIEYLNTDVGATSVAMTLTQLYNAIRLIAPDGNWNWLRALKRRLHARAKPQDRFERLVPAHQTLDLGITLMMTADNLTASGRLEREIQFRDGLILAILSLWPIRRRSLAALALDGHVRRRVGDNHLELLLLPEDTKSHRMESWLVPEILLPYVKRYLDEVRPRLARAANHDAFWVGQHGHPLSEGGLYAAVCRRTTEAYGLAMSLHDFRRAAATFLAMESPEKVGLIPGILQHATPETGDRHYNLARSTSASRRHSETLYALKVRLRPAPR